VSLLSYAGRVWVGVQSDVSLVPDPERIVSAFEEEVEALRLIRPSRKRTSARRDEVPAAVR
jgi:3-deoxy-D-arabino-heptulosonate 7-phosphate (DAHP) synthase class II